MTQIRFESNFAEITKGIRQARPDVARALRKELLAIAKDVALATREKVPSGMQAAKTGVSWSYYGSKGAVIKAGGNSAPKSWVGAYDGAGKKATFRHPVYPKAGSNRKKWHWATQRTNPILEKTWVERRDEAIAASQASIAKALRLSGAFVEVI